MKTEFAWQLLDFSRTLSWASQKLPPLTGGKRKEMKTELKAISWRKTYSITFPPLER